MRTLDSASLTATWDFLDELVKEGRVPAETVAKARAAADSGQPTTLYLGGRLVRAHVKHQRGGTVSIVVVEAT